MTGVRSSDSLLARRQKGSLGVVLVWSGRGGGRAYSSVIELLLRILSEGLDMLLELYHLLCVHKVLGSIPSRGDLCRREARTGRETVSI